MATSSGADRGSTGSGGGGGGGGGGGDGAAACHIWLRDEVKPGERRTAITPATAKALIAAGFGISVEKSQTRIYPDSDYSACGCTLVATGTWKTAPEDAFIVGLKELPESDEPLSHKHVFFAHAFKGQAGWQDVLRRFVQGGGSLYDMEYLVDEQGRRVAAFGRPAGMVGAAVAVAAWAAAERKASGSSLPDMGSLTGWDSEDAMVQWVLASLGPLSPPNVLVMGALGRSGRGACDVLKAIGCTVTEWDLEETKAGGPFGEILQHQVLINCILLRTKIPPFITMDMLQGKDAVAERALSVIGDVSCDNSNPMNPIPFFNKGTTLTNPIVELVAPEATHGNGPVFGVAIDHLPTLLPRESSDSYSEDLLPHLLRLGEGSGPWKAALSVFRSKVDSL